MIGGHVLVVGMKGIEK